MSTITFHAPVIDTARFVSVVVVPVSYRTDPLGPPVEGSVQIVSSADRVRVGRVVGEDVMQSFTLDPNEPENTFEVIAAEIEKIEPLTIPVTTDSYYAMSAVAQAYVINGRVEW